MYKKRKHWHFHPTGSWVLFFCQGMLFAFIGFCRRRPLAADPADAGRITCEA